MPETLKTPAKTLQLHLQEVLPNILQRKSKNVLFTSVGVCMCFCEFTRAALVHVDMLRVGVWLSHGSLTLN